MPSPDASIIELAKYTVEVLDASINSGSGPDVAQVSRLWAKRSDKVLETLEGRKVDVWHNTYSDSGPATREEDFYSVTLSIVIAERYAERQEVPNEWVDELVSWVEDKVFNPLASIGETTLDGSTGNPLRLGEWWTQNLVVVNVCDPDFLRQQKLFWSELELTYTRLKG